MYKKCSEYFRSNVDEAPGGLSRDERNISKDNLLHKIIRAYIKHVDETICMKCNIQACGNSDKHKKESTWKKKVLRMGAVFVCKYEKKT